MNAKAYIPIFLVALTCLMASGGCKSKKSKTPYDTQAGPGQPGEFDSYFIDACTHANNGNHETALKLFAKCRDMKPEEASVYYEMSRVYDKTNEKDLALQNAMKACEFAPQNKFYALWYAVKLRQNNNVDLAIEVLEKTQKANPMDEPVVKELDYLYDRKGDTRKRIALWNDYQDHTNYKLNTSLKLIELYRSIKDYQAAHRVYEQIKKASPGKYQYFIDDANLYLEHGDEVNANLNFEKAIEINPNNWKVNYALYQSYRKKNDKLKAGMYLGKAFADVNTSFESKTSTCIELNNEVKTDTSARYYTNIVAAELVKLYPGNANAILTAARFYEQGGNLNAALDNYQKAYSINPNMFDAWLGAINTSERLGLDKNTAAVSEKALEYYPNVSSLYASAAKAFNRLKEYQKAIDYCTSGKSFALDNEARYNLLVQEGFALFKLKKYQEAEKAYEAALAINSGEKELYDEMGNVKFFLNKADEAVNNWKKARELGLNTTTINKKISDAKYYE